MTGPQAADAPPPEENSAAAERESTATENSNADCNSAAAAADDPCSTTQTDPAVDGAEASDTSGGGLGSAYRTPTGERSAASRGSADSTDSNSDNSDASGGASGDTPPDKVENTVVGILRILGLQRRTKKYLEDNYPTLHELEEFLQLSSEEIRATMAQVKEEREEDGGEYDKTDEKAPAIFNQADRERLILLGRWKNNRGDGQKNKLEDFNKESFNAFAHNVDYNILDEILNELKISKEAKDKIKKEKVFTPAIFVEKSKYWYKHKIALNDADIYEIEKFKKWYKYQLDIYLPSYWIVSFRKEAEQVKELEWRKVLRAIGLKADAIQALEINDVCDIATLNETSKEWKIGEPREWQKMGLRENDVRHIINFRHWHNFYVAKKDKSDWAAEFSNAQYERFVQRYIDPSKLDEFKRPGLWASKGDSLKLCQEKKEYLDMLVAAAEGGVVTEKERYHLRQQLKGRKEKMELIQEIDEGVGDISFQEKRLGEIIENEVANEINKDALVLSQKYLQFFFSAFLVVTLLYIWFLTTLYLMLDSDFCGQPTSENTTNTTNNDGQPTSENTTPAECDNSYAIFIHNITFGLVTAVVIQELGDFDEKVEKKNLYHRFLPIYNEQLDRFRALEGKRHGKWRTRCFRFYTQIILFSTQYYIYIWIVGGAVSLIFGMFKPLQPTDPLYTTGQTWAGVAVTIGYSYFGLDGKSAPKIEDAKDAMDQRINDDAVQRANGGDGANGGEEAKFTDEKGEKKVIKTHFELMNEIDRYKGLREKAEDDSKDTDASNYQKCLDRLEKLKPLLPTVEELESQLKEAKEKRNAAGDKEDIDDEDKYHKEVIKLKRKLKEENSAAASGDVSSS